jgi:membrane peptidoglycan carboxypeptidase
MERIVDVPKPRILELYFNVIEFGPRIYGIHQASVHYFGKRPEDLSLTESVFLVSLVPDPKEYHRFYEDGEITDSWFESLMTYIEIMEDRGRATAEDVERARDDRPSFYKPAPEEPRLRPSSGEDDGADSGSRPIEDFFDDF